MDALIVVDMQNDFISGSLPIKGSKDIISKINSLIDSHLKKGDIVIATLDSHSLEHKSFIQNGGIWPIHCVVDTLGWQFDSKIHFQNFQRVFKKGFDPKIESYSGFFDEKNNSNGIDEYFKKNKVEKVYVCGLALDFCVQATASDAAKLKYDTYIYLNATKSVFPEKTNELLDNLKRQNIKLI